jgi:hypothetical protein
MASILAGALADLGSPNALKRIDAVRWFRYPDLPVAVSLRDCCDVLGLRPRHVSRHALRWSGLACHDSLGPFRK